MKPTLSISIPIYNFAKFVPETLDSILGQDGASKVEIVILDGASTDNTAEVIEGYRARHGAIRYVRMPQKGGIDRDMAHSVTHATGDYVWLFSGDDWMLPGALSKALEQIKSGDDLYLTRHMEWIDDRSEWIEWPTVNVATDTVFHLSDPAQRRDYFSKAVNTEAFFSFIGGLIVKRATWERVPLNENFVGGCWAHAARLCELMSGGLTVKTLTEPYLKRRPDNDSFANRGLVNRFRIAIDGYHQIADEIFGHDSFEALQMRRAVRSEYHPLVMLLGKYLCAIDPEHEDRKLMDRLLRKTYCDRSMEALRTRISYALMTPARFRRQQPELCRKFDRLKAELRGQAGA
ncbi:glycosyltransferase [Methylocystis sp. WRRC1]|uniref:glycosyltransferase family 2 protein n=1 Tax=Methylocystis sp. WRRC1 TaxID=1732014 RepID=UPI001D146DF2|nr:glycosyltransferase family 2 protein [Methylocystis sp. WRRC1]MCC3247228.1 glycosyltransferase [Methylocystis sp. WRRC1]